MTGGCHATSDDLDICIEGDNNGTITIDGYLCSGNCANEVTDDT